MAHGFSSSRLQDRLDRIMDGNEDGKEGIIATLFRADVEIYLFNDEIGAIVGAEVTHSYYPLITPIGRSCETS
jgi:hypothetical protein